MGLIHDLFVVYFNFYLVFIWYERRGDLVVSALNS